MELLIPNPKPKTLKNRLHQITTTTITAVKTPYQILTTTLLSLLLPLSFLLLARLSTANYFLSISETHPTPKQSFLTSLLLFTQDPSILHLSLSLISISSLSYLLTGTTHRFITRLPKPLTRTHLYSAWTILFIFQLSVFFGIENSEATGIDGSGYGQQEGLISRTVFFFGLHETTLFWWKVVVKPVVDDTIFGGVKGEGWVEKAVVGMGYGGLWWWRLREEVEALVVVPVVKRELMMGIGVADFVGWWLYYLTATIGVVRIVKGVVSTVAVLTRGRRRVDVELESRLLNADDKV